MFVFVQWSGSYHDPIPTWALSCFPYYKYHDIYHIISTTIFTIIISTTMITILSVPGTVLYVFLNVSNFMRNFKCVNHNDCTDDSLVWILEIKYCTNYNGWIKPMNRATIIWVITLVNLTLVFNVVAIILWKIELLMLINWKKFGKRAI